ncbi:MAG: hypothetical protein AB2637_00030 [Candidatus Thiodiazotropha sp.]|nr:hypothetical protein [Candidatus Thiodiazotropha sp. (ex Lucina pensylvanica)]PUB77240.1 MAG: hypothetical protein DBO99_10890 [gamma proteobacterium symbiont of Ctena orbiculata]
MRIHAAIIILIATLPSLGHALDGWDRDLRDGLLVYRPESLDDGKTFLYRAVPPESLSGRNLHQWFSAKIAAMQDQLGEPLESWKIKAEKNDHLGAANSYIAPSGEKFSVGYYAGYLNDDQAYIIQMISNQDIWLVLRYGFALDKVAADVRENLPNLSQSPPALTHPATGDRPQKSADREKGPTKTANKPAGRDLLAQIRTAPGDGVKDELETVWVKTKINVMRGKLEPTTYFLFADGTAYIDARTPPADFNAATSKRLEGRGKWGQWRKRGGKYQVKRPKVGRWENIKGNRAVPGKRGERIDNKFINASGSANFGSHKSSVRLMSNGRFELSHSSLMGGGGIIDIAPKVLASGQSDKTGTRTTLTTMGSKIGGGSSTSNRDGANNTGTYEIDGYTIEMHHDNGLVHRELFLFEDERKNRIVIGDTVYWVDMDG